MTARVVLLWTCGVWLWAQDYSGRAISSIRFQPELETARFQEAIALKEGQPFDPEAARRTLENLHATGRFADIAVDLTPEGPGVAVTLLVKLNYFIGAVEVEGVRAPPTPRQLAYATRLELGEAFTDEKRDRAVDAIRRLLERHGYHQAKIGVEPQFDDATQQVDVRFRIAAPPRARIQEIEWTGHPGLPVDQLALRAKLKPGDPATAREIDNAIARLRQHYTLRERLAARLELVERHYLPESNSERVVLRVDAGPRVVVSVTGSGLKAGTLRELLPVYIEAAHDQELVREGSRVLRDHLYSQGFIDAQVREQRREDPDGTVHIAYQVERGVKHTVAGLEIRGNKFFNEATIRERLGSSTRTLALRGRFNQRLLDQDIARIRDLYQSNGFQQIQVLAHLEDDFGGKEGRVMVRLRIEEGAQTLVRTLTLTGNRQVPRDELLAMIAHLEGQPFSQTNALIDRDNLLAYYYDLGYTTSAFTWKATPAPDPNLVDVEYTIQEGRPESVHKVLVGGQHFTRPKVIEQQIELRPGEELSRTALFDTQRNLYDLGIFNRVGIALQNPEGEEAARNVLLQVEESPRWTVATGVGAELARLGGDRLRLESSEGTTAFAPRVSFDVTRLNFRGLNQTLSLKTLVSTRQQRALLGYTSPRVWNMDNWTLYVNGYAERTVDVNTFTAQRLEGSLAFAQKRSKSDTAIYRYSYRRVEATSLRITSSLIPVLSRPVRVGIPSLTFIRDRRDDPADSTKGVYFTADLGASWSKLGSEANFSRLLAQHTSYHKIGKDLVLARTTQFGLQEPFGGLRRVEVPREGDTPLVTFTREAPIAERFFSGGGNSHRGFGVNQAGPRDLDTGFPIGGSGLLMNSVELRFPVRRPDIGGVLFHDAGNVFRRVGDITFRVNQRDEKDFDYMVHAVGLGVRYRTPIGPLRLDFALSLNPARYFGLIGDERELLLGTARRELRRLSRFQFFFSIGQTY